MMMRGFILTTAASVAILAGCGTSYCWRPQVPAEMRTITVPTFANETDVTEIGAVAARQLLREIQREGTFRIATDDNAALEVQGVVKKISSSDAGRNRRTGMRYTSVVMEAEAEVSIIDKARRAVLIDGRRYPATSTVTASQDLLTARRDASGRVMDDLARQVVDDLVNMKFSE